ncbi:hypothetical protein WOLCODRAFT_16000 [Wolfiporia cocos MD-104 SS10]|uniref:Uncharacterized protein n=1 Tax=Wolfiporia cocos (strain MD-104) TaxID=742152 RepID=A0A2H3J9S2_WOLCO|nr:hypothetical protein WOLCODRAFT_16000 [Wolfiporia cocos MD-104 SS10]
MSDTHRSSHNSQGARPIHSPPFTVYESVWILDESIFLKTQHNTFYIETQVYLVLSNPDFRHLLEWASRSVAPIIPRLPILVHPVRIWDETLFPYASSIEFAAKIHAFMMLNEDSRLLRGDRYHPPISRDSEFPGWNGQPRKRVPVLNASNNQFHGLEGANDPMPFDNNSQKMSIRILWPGCDEHNEQVNIRSKVGQPLKTVGHIVLSVAQIMIKYYNANKDRECASEHEEWRLGPNHITLDRITLVGISQNTVGSLQPVLRFHQSGKFSSNFE